MPCGMDWALKVQHLSLGCAGATGVQEERAAAAPRQGSGAVPLLQSPRTPRRSAHGHTTGQQSFIATSSLLSVQGAGARSTVFAGLCRDPAGVFMSPACAWRIADVHCQDCACSPAHDCPGMADWSSASTADLMQDLAGACMFITWLPCLICILFAAACNTFS